MATWGLRKPPPGPLFGPNMILDHYRLARHRVWSSRALTRPLEAVVAACSTSRQEERCGADHPGTGSGSDIFWKIQKIIKF